MPPPDPTPTGAADLPQRLRQATAALHHDTERSGAMALLLQGRLSHAGYRALLGNLLPLYGALESALARHAGARWLAGFDLGALARRDALAADLAGAEAAPPLPPAEAYVQRLQALGRDGDPALLAHVYTRYLGDLHGGQILRRLVQRLYPGQGTAFHDFGDEPRVRALRDAVRTGLAGCALPAAACDRVVAEACWSFEQHQRLFEALPG